jgi:L-asparaginase
MSGSLVLLSMGGTISAGLGDRGYSPKPGADASGLIGSLPEGVEDVKVESIQNALSFSSSFAAVRRLVSRIDELATDVGVAGFVVSHGTAAMEEVAYLCDLTIKTSKPVVFTGATYHASDPGSDGPHNITDALTVAASNEASGLGVLVCFAGELHAAREAVKLHRYIPAPFISSLGPLGWVNATGVRIERVPRDRASRLFPADPVLWVPVVPAVMDDDGRLMAPAIERGAAGLVVEGFPGGGGVPPAMLAVGERAIEKGIPVVVAPRSPLGQMVRMAGGDSGPAVLAEKGFMAAGDLTAAKARVLATAAIANGCDRDGVQSLFSVAPGACFRWGEAMSEGKRTRHLCLQTIGVGKSYGGLDALRSVDLEVPHGSRHGLIGTNGAGKSTLLATLSSFERPSSLVSR